MRIPIAFAIILILLTVIVDLYIWWDIKTYKPGRRKNARRPKTWARVYGVFALFCWIMVVVILALPRRSETSDIGIVMWLLVTYLTIFIPKVIFMIFSLLGKIPLLWKGKRWHTGMAIGLPVAISAFIIMWWGILVTRNDIVVNEITVASKDIPKGFNGYKIVQFSDIHVGTWGADTAFVSKLVDEINGLDPDLIVFTGDIVNRNTEELQPFKKVFSSLKAKDGVYSILGNHDYGFYQDWESEAAKEADHSRLINDEREMGWNLMLNTHTSLKHNGDSIILAGVENWGEPPFEGTGDLDKALEGAPMGYTILLTHNPQHWNKIVSKRKDVDLSLSGHTHAMQMILKIGNWRWSPVIYRYPQWSGLYERENDGKPSLLYVNIGAGEVGIPLRMLAAKPEITVITLQHED